MNCKTVKTVQYISPRLPVSKAFRRKVVQLFLNITSQLLARFFLHFQCNVTEQLAYKSVTIRKITPEINILCNLKYNVCCMLSNQQYLERPLNGVVCVCAIILVTLAINHRKEIIILTIITETRRSWFPGHKSDKSCSSSFAFTSIKETWLKHKL